MQFGDKTETIRQAFKETISECRYVPRVIDEKEHNHQIVPEILYEISKSKFVVVDITFPNILMKGFRALEVGQRVSYQIEPTEKGNKAINVVVE